MMAGKSARLYYVTYFAAGALLLLCGSAPAAQARRAPIDAPAAASAPAPAPEVSVTFDDSAVRQLLTMVEKRDTDDSHLEAWLDLPANKRLLEVGAQEENLTRAQLKANALEVINGKATEASMPSDDMGCVRVEPTADYERMLGGLAASSTVRSQQIADRVKQFCPPGIKIKETVYLHLGGDWDAVNYEGSVYVNIRYWREGRAPGWDGLNMIIAHETMHTVQNQAYGNPQLQDTGSGAWLTALSKIQREGTARLVEYDTDAYAYRPNTYGFYERAIDTETLRSFPRDLALLTGLCDSCFPAFDHEKFVDEFTNGMNLGGPYYDIGHGVAKAIDDKLGRQALIGTVAGGPKAFFGAYSDLCKSDSKLPKLPDKVAAAIAQMPERVGDSK